ncbi:hypothetical protein [Nocardioides sp. 1609]|uniref:hypothetical protein n=1 Tax=Nocardioides sp. 1609 TaxID=2508327 RepID=UPI0010706781|nr:hypothetical protein [Nocardioides sp. 1609]
MRTLISVAVLTLTLTACGGGDEPQTGPTETVTVTSTPTFLGDPTEAVTETPTEEADPFAPNIGDRSLKVGQPRIGTGITTVLLETDLGVTEQYRDPEQGNQYYGLRVSTCVRKDFDTAADGDVYSTYPGEWYAVTKSGDEYTSSSSYSDFPSPKYPENVTVAPGTCVKGWIAIEVPEDVSKYEKLVYRPGGETIAEWIL